MQGFLGTGATLRADLNLILQILMGLALLLGAVLARKKKFKAHQYCQTSVVVLNLFLIIGVMYPSFQVQVLPRVPTGLTSTYHMIAFIHAILGSLAEGLGLYIVLVAGTNLLPASLRFQNYKVWMRTALALWWCVIALGIATYCFWYLVPQGQAGQATHATLRTQSIGRATVRMSNFKFEPNPLVIAVGTVVEWVGIEGRHTIEGDNGTFKSEDTTAGGRFEHRFDEVGTFPYFCGYHGDKGGQDMAGVIRVMPKDPTSK